MQWEGSMGSLLSVSDSKGREWSYYDDAELSDILTSRASS